MVEIYLMRYQAVRSSAPPFIIHFLIAVFVLRAVGWLRNDIWILALWVGCSQEQGATSIWSSSDLQVDDSVFPVTGGGAVVGWGWRKGRYAAGIRDRQYGRLHENHDIKEMFLAYSQQRIPRKDSMWYPVKRVRDESSPSNVSQWQIEVWALILQWFQSRWLPWSRRISSRLS